MVKGLLVVVTQRITYLPPRPFLLEPLPPALEPLSDVIESGLLSGGRMLLELLMFNVF